MPVLSLDHLALQIAEQESQLKTLRREHASRQAKLLALRQRKKHLQTRLRDLDAKIQAVTRTEAVTITGNGKIANNGQAAQVIKTESATPSAKPPQGTSLASLILDEVRAAKGQPVTLQELAKKVLPHFSTQSSKPFKMVENRVYDLARRGVLKRLPGGGGFVLAKPKPEATVVTNDKKSASAATTKPGKPTTSAAPTGKAKENRTSLRDLLLSILRRAKQPLQARDLAEKVLATGYTTQSQNFRHVIWVALGKLNDQVELAPAGGYRLKRGK